MTDIAARAKKIIIEHLGVDEAPDAAHILNDLGGDSLDTVELVMAFEEEFGIEVPDDDMEKIGTVGEVIALIEKLAA